MVSDHLRSPYFRSWSTKTSLVNAFALVCLPKICAFHRSLQNTKNSNCPFQSLQGGVQFLLRKTPPVIFHHPMLIYSIIDTIKLCPQSSGHILKICFKHSIFLKVNKKAYPQDNLEPLYFKQPRLQPTLPEANPRQKGQHYLTLYTILPNKD